MLERLTLSRQQTNEYNNDDFVVYNVQMKGANS